MADRDPRKDPREGDEFEAPPRLQEQRTIIERYEKDGKAMVRYETSDEWGETYHHFCATLLIPSVGKESDGVTYENAM